MRNILYCGLGHRSWKFSLKSISSGMLTSLYISYLNPFLLKLDKFSTRTKEYDQYNTWCQSDWMQEILREIMRLNSSYRGYKGSRFRGILLHLKDCQGPCNIIVEQLLKMLPIDFWNEISTDDILVEKQDFPYHWQLILPVLWWPLESHQPCKATSVVSASLRYYRR